MVHSLENPERFNEIPNDVFERISNSALGMMEKKDQDEALGILENNSFKEEATQSWGDRLSKNDSVKTEIELAIGLKIRVKEKLKNTKLS